jgi:hypothetical protein
MGVLYGLEGRRDPQERASRRRCEGECYQHREPKVATWTGTDLFPGQRSAVGIFRSERRASNGSVTA